MRLRNSWQDSCYDRGGRVCFKSAQEFKKELQMSIQVRFGTALMSRSTVSVQGVNQY